MGEFSLETGQNEELPGATHLVGVINSAMDAIVSIDHDQKIVLFNAAAELMFRCSAEQALGQPVDILIPERFRSGHGEHIEDFGKTGVTSRSMRSLGELSGRRFDGEEFPIEASISQVEVAKQKLFTVILRDVTERNRTEAALQSERNFIDAVIDTVGSIVIVVDRNGTIVRTNRVFEEITGYTSEEATGRNCIALLMVPEEAGAATAAIQSLYDGDFPSYHRYFVIAKDGSRRLIEWSDTCMLDANGEVEFVIGTGTDITDRQVAEESSLRMAAIVEYSDDAIIGKNLRGIVTTWNAGAQKMFGYSAADIVGHPITTLIPPDRLSEEEHILTRIKRGESIDHFETVRIARDGRSIDVSVTISPIKDSWGTVVGASKILRDITEKKRAAEKMAWLASFPERNPDPIIELDSNHGEIDYINPAALRLFPDLVERKYRHPLLEGLLQAAQGLIADGGGVVYRETSVGQRAYLNTIHFIAETKRLRIYGRDITELKSVEAELRRQAEQLQEQAQLVDLAQILIRDMDNRIVLWNRGAELLYGWSQEEALGQVTHSLFQTQFPEAQNRIEAELLSTGHWDGDLIHTKRNGERLVVSSQWVLHRDKDGNPQTILEVNNDITERKRAEEALRKKDEEVRTMTQQLWQTAKLATMGELSASIAHELNNPLFTVTLRVESLLARFDADDPMRRSVEIVGQEVKRMADLVAQLLEFSRRNQSQISTLDVRDEIEKTLELIAFHLRKYNIAVVREFSAEMPTVQADRQQMRQIFLNLFNNAADAMAEGGILTIRIYREPAEVVIEISDTGTGIPEPNLTKLMEPFFTTKAEGKGTGLGLAICRRIVQEHHGTFEIYNGPERGATARITLPATSGGS